MDHKQLDDQIQQLIRENQRQRALLDAIFDADPGGLAVVAGPDLRFAYANPAYRYICPQLGIDPTGRTYAEIWADAEINGFHDKIQNVLETGRPFQTLGYPRRYPDGSTRHFTFQARRIEWENELAALIILWDTTELQKLEQAARDSEAYFRQLINLSPDAIFVQREGKFAFLNEAALRLFGAERSEQILGKPILDLIHPDFRGQVAERIRQLNVEQKQVAMVVETLLRLDGTPVEVEAVAAPYFQGNQPGAIVIAHDLTERILSERQVRAEREWFRTTLSSIGDAVITTDQEGKVTFLNPVAEQLTGWPAAAAAGQPLGQVFTIINEQTHQPAKNPVERVLREGHVVGLANHTALISRSGQLIPIEDSAAPIKDSQGQGLGVVMVFHDVTEKRRAEQALEESEARFRLLAETIPQLVWIADAEGQRYWFNQRWYDYTGATLEEMRGWGWQKVHHPDYLQRIMDTMRHAFAVGEGWENTYPLRGKDGQYRWFLSRALPQRDANGRVVRWFGTNTDITDQKLAEQRIAEEQEWFHTTLASIGDAVITTDQSGNVTFLNPVAEELTGWTRMDALGRSIQQIFLIINEQTRQPAQNPVERVLNEGHVVGLANHTALISRDGRTIPIEDSAAPIKNNAGDILGVVMVFHDVTEKRRAEAALRENQAMLRTVLEGTPDLIFMKDRDSRVLLANPATIEMIGRPAEQIIGKQDIEFYANQEAARDIMENDQRVMETGQTQVVEERVSFPTGERVFLSTKTPLRDDGGKIAGVIGVSRDITERKEREKELVKLNRTLQAMSKSNQAMMRAGDENQFMQEVCQIITQDCGYIMVWIGFAENDEARTVRPVASAGYEDGYLEKLKVTWADTERGRGPTGTAIRTGKPAMCANMLTDPNFAPWRADAIQRGYASSLVLPLMIGAKAIGAITIYSAEPNPFTADEVRLLSELANDLSYGLTAFRLRAQHARAEASLRLREAHLRESEARYRSLFDGMTEGFALHEIILDEQGVPNDYRFLDINPAFERLTGLTQAEVKGKNKSQIEKLQGDDPKWVEIYGKVALTGEPVYFENYSPALQRYYEVYAYRPAPQQFAVLFMDITERRVAEDALRDAKEAAIRNQSQIEVQRRLIEQREQERQQIARDLHDGPVQVLTAASFNLQGLAMDTQDPRVVSDLNAARESIQEAIHDLRMYAQELRPPILFNFGLRRAIEAYLEGFQEKHPELHINMEVHWAGQVLPEQVAIGMFRIFQESLNNVIKHAQASDVWVRLERSDRQFNMEIADNGVGFVAPRDLLGLARQGHLGLVGISERAEAIGGRLEIDSRPGGGARIKISVPLA